MKVQVVNINRVGVVKVASSPQAKQVKVISIDKPTSMVKVGPVTGDFTVNPFAYGSNDWIQYSWNNRFRANAEFRYDHQTNTLSVPNVNVGSVVITSNTIALGAVSPTPVDSFNAGQFRSAKYMIQANAAGNFVSTEMLIMHDGANCYVGEYGTMLSGADLGSFTANVVGSIISLIFTPNFSNTTVKFARLATIA